ncbi:hypothetical protein [Streptomyces sp. NBC_01727]|uniref:hypothetical protein n=1 Tax=Streptomyces sp. NBC_01727 TaxID=2975924 RepID=UPI002E11428A|nr:hypothetical protein OIE76_01415 [Streptomyces sp. NBC_01727]
MTDRHRGRLRALPPGRDDRRLPQEEGRVLGRVIAVLDDLGVPVVRDVLRSVEWDADVPAGARVETLFRSGRVLGLDLVPEVAHRQQVTP